MVHGEDSDLFNVLAYVAYTKDMVPRMKRAKRARAHFNDYSPAQQEFLNFVLDQYVRSWESQLDDSRIRDLLILRYHAIADAKQKLGEVSEIREAFISFQQHIYKSHISTAQN